MSKNAEATEISVTEERGGIEGYMVDNDELHKNKLGDVNQCVTISSQM